MAPYGHAATAVRLARATVAVALLGLALVTAPVAALGVSGGPLDFGHVDRGDTATGTFVVRGDAAADTDVTMTIENDPAGALRVSPTTTTVPAGSAVPITVTLTTPPDAVPGRHQPAVVVAETTTTGGNIAGSAVRVPALYVVQAVDVAVAQFADDTAQVRIVNGHAGSRTIGMTVTSVTTALEHEAAPVAIAGGASWLVEWTPVWANVANGTHTIHITGTATGGKAPEAFDAMLRLSVAGRETGFASPTPVPMASGGGGGGGGAAPAAPAGPMESAPPVADTGSDGAVDGASGAGGGHPASTARSLPDFLFREGLPSRGAPTGDTSFTGTEAVPAEDDTSTTPAAPWAVSVVLAMAGLACAASGLRKGFKNRGGKRPPS